MPRNNLLQIEILEYSWESKRKCPVASINEVN